MKSVKHLWASLLIVMAFVIICPSALAATGNSSQVHSENPVDAYPNSTIGVIHFYIDDGKLIVYNPDERTSVRGRCRNRNNLLDHSGTSFLVNIF